MNRFNISVLRVETLSDDDVEDLNNLFRIFYAKVDPNRTVPHISRDSFALAVSNPLTLLGVARDTDAMRGTPPTGRIVAMSTLAMIDLYLYRRGHYEFSANTPGAEYKLLGARINRHLRIVAQYRMQPKTDFVHFIVSDPAVAEYWRTGATTSKSTFEEKGTVFRLYFDSDVEEL